MIIVNSGADRVDEFRIVLMGQGDRTLIEADGKPYGEYHMPFSRVEIEQALADISPNRVTTDPLISFGTTLFNSVFSGPLGRELWTRLGDVGSKNRGLRLRIETNLERAQHLPWELLFDPSRGDFMSLSGRVALVRTRPEKSDLSLEPLDRLRILAVEADPIGTLRTSEDLAKVRQIAERAGHVVETLPMATPEDFEARLRGSKYDVLHFAGTGEVGPYPTKRGGLRQALRLLGPDASESLVDPHELGDLLKQAGVRLVVLNACHTDWAARSLARYVPLTIGFREVVRDEACLVMCEAFYQAVVAGTSLDLAVTATRQALDRALPGTGDWCKLIFYMQQRDGRFVRPAQERETVGVRAGAEETSSKEAVKLSRLIDIYKKNLSVQTSVGSSEDLQKKVENLESRLSQLRQQPDE